MHRRRDQLTISAVAFALGLLAIVQLRTQQVSPGLSALSAQELTVLVANLNTRNDELRTEVATLSGQLSQFQATQSRGQSSVDQIRADLARVSGINTERVIMWTWVVAGALVLAM